MATETRLYSYCPVDLKEPQRGGRPQAGGTTPALRNESIQNPEGVAERGKGGALNPLNTLSPPRGFDWVKFWSIFSLNSVINFSRFNRTPIDTQSIPDSYPTITAGYYQDEDRGLKEVVLWTFVPPL